jgi:hypothetical protein
VAGRDDFQKYVCEGLYFNQIMVRIQKVSKDGGHRQWADVEARVTLGSHRDNDGCWVCPGPLC